MLSDPVAEAFGLIHRHTSGENFFRVCVHCTQYTLNLYGGLLGKLSVVIKMFRQLSDDISKAKISRLGSGIFSYQNILMVTIDNGYV